MKVICEYCKKAFDKPASQIRKTNHNFCSRKCSCAKGNEVRWKDHICVTKDIVCSKCNTKRNYQTKGCPFCKGESKKNITIGQIKEKYIKNKHLIHWYSSEVRGWNRRWNSELLKLPCQKCGYSQHVELCHIKPINSFDDSTIIGKINENNNNVILCPNHHWEFDNGILQLKDIPERNGGVGGT